MLILLPKSNDGLKELITNFNYYTLAEIDAKLKPELIQLSVPKFNLESTNRAEKSLFKSGLSLPFTPEADFSRITKQQKIHLEELVQHVSFRVDEGSSSENLLTASSVFRNVEPERSIMVNRPFLYFVRDMKHDIIIIAGKFTTPPVTQEMATEEEE